MILSLLGFAIVIVLAFLRVPIAIAMGLVGVVGFAGLNRWNWTAALSPAGGSVLDTLQTESLSVVPLFILMGMLVSQAGMATELYRASNAFLGHRRGGLAMATIVACGGFSAISGSSLATAATMAKVAMPQMRAYNYGDGLASASIAAGGTLGILIPPSIILIIYGIMTGQSIEKLFLAGLLPGLLGIALYLVAVRWVVWRKPESGPAGGRSDWSERLAAMREVWPIVLLFLAILGGIYMGVWTVTEAAGAGAGLALIIGVAKGRLTWSALKQALYDTAKMTAILFAVLIGADMFQRFIVRARLPDALVSIVSGLDISPLTVVLLMILVYVVLGCVFESLSMLLLTVPVFAPIVEQLGFFADYPAPVAQELSLIWFGIIVVVVTEISLITPPIGLNVFVLRGVIGDISAGTIFRGVTPFWIVDIIRVLLLLFIPWIALVLPMTMRPFG